MAEDQDDSQKTEDPTHRRLEEAFKRGQIFQSREVSNFIMLLSFALVLSAMVPLAMGMAVPNLERFISSPHLYSAESESMHRLLTDVTLKGIMVLMVIVAGIFVAALASNMLQRRTGFSWEPLMPKLEKISPIKGFGRIFSMRSVVEFVKGLIKIGIIGFVATSAALPYMDRLYQLPGYDMPDLLDFIGGITMKMMVAICIAMAFVAVLDYFYQRFEYMKSLRMSRQELRDEFKESEGDPHVKARVRAIRAERARKRMMAAVPTADVVITNPTHFAVALKYDRATMPAPIMVAKGQDNIALKIREIAEENKVTVVENPPVARALFANVEIDQPIPAEYYQAVAEIIGYVFRLKGKIK